MLLAAGAVWGQQRLSLLPPVQARRTRRATRAALAVGRSAVAAVTLHVAPVNSRWWHVADGLNGNFNEEIGWLDVV